MTSDAQHAFCRGNVIVLGRASGQGPSSHVTEGAWPVAGLAIRRCLLADREHQAAQEGRDHAFRLWLAVENCTGPSSART